MSTLGTLASSLLVLGSVLKGSVGEAFLAALAVTGKYQVGSLTMGVRGLFPWRHWAGQVILTAAVCKSALQLMTFAMVCWSDVWMAGCLPVKSFAC